MHCDDKRMIVVLKDSIINCFNELKEKYFDDKLALKNLNDTIIDYKEYKLSLKEK